MEHPITPPDELVEQWKIEWASIEWASIPPGVSALAYIATQAARWGADQELEACCEWLDFSPKRFSAELRAARRPKPPSLKEQALALLDKNKTRFAVAEEDVIRLALESLPD